MDEETCSKDVDHFDGLYPINQLWMNMTHEISWDAKKYHNTSNYIREISFMFFMSIY